MLNPRFIVAKIGFLVIVVLLNSDIVAQTTDAPAYVCPRPKDYEHYESGNFWVYRGYDSRDENGDGECDYESTDWWLVYGDELNNDQLGSADCATCKKRPLFSFLWKFSAGSGRSRNRNIDKLIFQTKIKMLSSPRTKMFFDDFIVKAPVLGEERHFICQFGIFEAYGVSLPLIVAKPLVSTPTYVDEIGKFVVEFPDEKKLRAFVAAEFEIGLGKRKSRKTLFFQVAIDSLNTATFNEILRNN